MQGKSSGAAAVAAQDGDRQPATDSDWLDSQLVGRQEQLASLGSALRRHIQQQRTNPGWQQRLLDHLGQLDVMLAGMGSLLAAEQQPLGIVTEVQENVEAHPGAGGQPSNQHAAPGTPAWACLPHELLAAILHPARVGKEARAVCKSFRGAFDAGVQRATLHLLEPAVLFQELLPAPPPAPVVRLDAAYMFLSREHYQSVVTKQALASALERWPVSVPLQLHLRKNEFFECDWPRAGTLRCPLAGMLRCATFAPGGLQVLDLSKNHIGPVCAQLLADAMTTVQQLSSLRELALRHCGLSAEGTVLLCGALQAATHMRSLAVLNLSCNHMQPTGAAALAACLRGAPHLAASLRQLLVSDNAMAAEGAVALADGVAACGVQLTHLDVSLNDFLCDGAKAWAAALTASTCLAGLEVLDLSSNGVGSGGIAALCQSLLAATHLERLQRLALLPAGGPAGTECFAQLLLHAPHLAGIQQLQLGDDATSSREPAAVAATLLAAGSPLAQLRSLHLKCSCTEDLQRVCSTLPGASNLSGLRQLNISLPLTSREEGCQAVFAALRASPQLSELQQLSLERMFEKAHSSSSLLGLLRTAPHLRSLTAVHVKSMPPGGLAGLRDVLDLLPRLRSLKVEPGYQPAAVMELSSALRHALCVPNLEELSIVWKEYADEFGDGYGSDDSEAQSAGAPVAWTMDVLRGCTRMTGLRRLRIENVHMFTRNDFEWLATMLLASPHLSSLRELRVGSCNCTAQHLYEALATSHLAAVRVVVATPSW